jgi:hypothetical protein
MIKRKSESPSHTRRERSTGIWFLMGAMAVGLVSSLTVPVQAQDSFDNQVIQFPVDTTIEFEFKESHGAFQSSLGIIEVETGQPVKELFRENKPYDDFGSGQRQSRAGSNSIGTRLDYVGTVDGGTVQNRFNEFTFKANTRYALYLESVSPTGQTRRTVVSTSDLATAFDGALDSGNRSGVVGTRIAWDDDGLPQAKRKDNDFDDFVIEAGGYLVTVPCVPVK